MLMITKPIFASSPDLLPTQLLWRGAVLLICIVWSTNFVVVKQIMLAAPTLDPSMIAAIRFSIAAAAVLPRALLTMANPAPTDANDATLASTRAAARGSDGGNGGNADMVIGAAAIGASCFVGYFGQFTGLSLGTAANKAAFICSLNAVWVALLTSVFARQLKLQTWVCAALAVSGVAILELGGGGGGGGNGGGIGVAVDGDAFAEGLAAVGAGVESGFGLSVGAAAAGVGVGDLWSLGQPVGFGTGYVLLERSMRRHPASAGAVTAVKVATIAACSVAWAALSGHTAADIVPVLDAGPVAIGGLLYCGLVTTAAMMWLQSAAFKHVAATDVALVLTLEPLFAAAFAAAALGEPITPALVAGGLLITAACVANELNLVDRVCFPSGGASTATVTAPPVPDTKDGAAAGS
jgi:drug/metabolite transporter (DMT)-like permease